MHANFYLGFDATIGDMLMVQKSVRLGTLKHA
jgi:hypothetical protein